MFKPQFPISHPTKCTFILAVAWQMKSQMCLAVNHRVFQIHRITLGMNQYKWAQENRRQAQGGGISHL